MLWLLRLSAVALVAGGFITILIDGTRSIADDRWILTLISDIGPEFFNTKPITFQAASSALVFLNHLPLSAITILLGLLILLLTSRALSSIKEL